MRNPVKLSGPDVRADAADVGPTTARPAMASRTARACPVDHGTGSRSQMLIEATSMVPW
jgi:hypothetical protein